MSEWAPSTVSVRVVRVKADASECCSIPFFQGLFATGGGTYHRLRWQLASITDGYRRPVRLNTNRLWKQAVPVTALRDEEG